MIDDAKGLEKLLTGWLRPEGFRRHGRRWIADFSEVIEIVDLQRSQWSNMFYLNVGALVKAIGGEPWEIRDRTNPRSWESHYCIRLENLIPEEPIPPAKITPQVERMHQLLNLEDPRVSPGQRGSELSAIIEQRLIPFLRMSKDAAGLRAAIVGKVGYSTGATGVLRDHFRLPLGRLRRDT